MYKTQKCISNTVSGGQCKLPAKQGSKFCVRHSKCLQSAVEIVKTLKKERATGKYRCLTGIKRIKVRKDYEKLIKKHPKKILFFMTKTEIWCLKDMID